MQVHAMPTPRPACSSLRPRREPRPPTREQTRAVEVLRAAFFLHLTWLEQKVVGMRYGIGGYVKVHDLVEIADREGIPSYLAHRALLSGTAKLRAVPALRRLVTR